MTRAPSIATGVLVLLVGGMLAYGIEPVLVGAFVLWVTWTVLFAILAEVR